ncbi:MAG: hypothetical protein HYY78_10915 [Betaproteobacteria bacterium]|nr:hypothetical protein [Betaproteobacteria bacterium]
MRRWAWILALAAALAATSHAQLLRQLPANGKLGELLGRQQPYPLLQIGGKILRLAPGGRIVDQDNRVVLHSYLPEHAYVLFVEDVNGDVSRVYLLRPEELERLQRAR